MRATASCGVMIARLNRSIETSLLCPWLVDLTTMMYRSCRAMQRHLGTTLGAQGKEFIMTTAAEGGTIHETSCALRLKIICSSQHEPRFARLISHECNRSGFATAATGHGTASWTLTPRGLARSNTVLVLLLRCTRLP